MKHQCRMMLSGAVALVLGLMMAGSGQAASMLFNFNLVDSAAGLGAGPFGTVLVNENLGGLDFTITLNSAYRFHQGNANHSAFAFNLTGAPAISITGFSKPNFSRSAGSTFSEPPFGNGWNYALTYGCAGCNGFNGGSPGPLSFTVKKLTNVAMHVTDLSFKVYTDAQNKKHNVYFTSDLVNGAGKTGNVGAQVSGAVPEPATWSMMILGFGLVGSVARSRRVAKA